MNRALVVHFSAQLESSFNFPLIGGLDWLGGYGFGFPFTLYKNQAPETPDPRAPNALADIRSLPQPNRQPPFWTLDGPL